MNLLFDQEHFERLLPNYLSKAEKGRLLAALEQFYEQSVRKQPAWSSKFYTNFYLHKNSDYFLQGDLLMSIRQPNWNYEANAYDKIYAKALILSNTCDMDVNNDRVIPKEIVLAPLIPFSDFVEELSLLLEGKKLESIIQGVKSQIYSNVFYLPPVQGTSEDFVCFFDNVFWFPTEELNSYLPDLNQTRIASFDYFGYYLFLVKLSYHFCRLPEEKQR